MRSLRPLLFVSALLLTGWSALAQSSPDKGKWSGRASLTAGYGRSMPDGEAGEADTLQRFHQSAEVVARYETRKFSVATRLSQLQDRNETERIKMVYKTTKEGDEVSQLDLILRASNPRQKRYEARTDFRWRTSDRSTLSWYVGYVDIHNVTVNTMGQFQLIADREDYRFQYRSHLAAVHVRAEHAKARNRPCGATHFAAALERLHEPRGVAHIVVALRNRSIHRDERRKKHCQHFCSPSLNLNRAIKLFSCALALHASIVV